MLTARSSESDRVVGLDAGADDYVTKPFSPRELVGPGARGAAPRPAGRGQARRRFIAESTSSPTSTRCRLPSTASSIRLTRREFELLRHLVENRNRVLSRDRLLERVWGYDRMIETRSVDVHVGRLRGKLGAAGKQIETVVGLGYRFVETEK